MHFSIFYFWLNGDAIPQRRYLYISAISIHQGLEPERILMEVTQAVTPNCMRVLRKKKKSSFLTMKERKLLRTKLFIEDPDTNL